LPEADAFVRSAAPTLNYGGGVASQFLALPPSTVGQQNGLFDSLMRFSLAEAWRRLIGVWSRQLGLTGLTLKLTEQAAQQVRFSIGHRLI